MKGVAYPHLSGIDVRLKVQGKESDYHIVQNYVDRIHITGVHKLDCLVCVQSNPIDYTHLKATILRTVWIKEGEEVEKNSRRILMDG